MSKLEQRFSRRRRHRYQATKRDSQPNAMRLWKFQWPIHLSGDDAMVLVYDENKTHLIHLPIATEGLAELFEGHLKFYAWAQYNPDKGTFRFDRERLPIYDAEEFPEW